jgi:phage terminase small subunit
VEREIKMHDKIKALELLGKNLGMFTDNIKLQADVKANITNPLEGLSVEELKRIAAAVPDLNV